MEPAVRIGDRDGKFVEVIEFAFDDFAGLESLLSPF